MSLFIKKDNQQLIRANIEEYSAMDVDYFYRDVLPKICRLTNESWEHFRNRVHIEDEEFDEFAFGVMVDSSIDLEEIPEEYLDYQFVKFSEFGDVSKPRKIGLAHIDFDEKAFIKFKLKQYQDLGHLPGEEEFVKSILESISASEKKETKRESIDDENKYSISCINRSRVGGAFNYWEIKSQIINNSYNYLKNSCDINGIISLIKWLDLTGKSGRTKEIESFSEGTFLEWENKNKGDYSEINILSPNGKVVGEINRSYADEFTEVYVPFLNNRSLEIESIELYKLIPHKTPGGRPLKALAQVKINCKVINLIEDTDFTDLVKSNIQGVRCLSAIDYNRRCDIIEGVIPDRLEALNELFCDEVSVNGDPIACIDILRDKGFLSGSKYDASELEELWSVYSPLKAYCDLKYHNEDFSLLFSNEKKILSRKGEVFDYVLEYFRDELVIAGNVHPNYCIYLKIYKK